MPTRSPVNRAMAATLRLLEPCEDTDPAILVRVASGLRALPDPPPARVAGGTAAPHTPGHTGLPSHPPRHAGPRAGHH
ncbi:hypothetical protein [Nocardia sp. NPDC024068]|uniref:hypothetical protein n=1 Tax=Nocardia sp. NPDC024068 TaxID=3157197 RepID=UPI0033EC1946